MPVRPTTKLQLQIEYVPLASLVPNPLNPRKHPARQLKALARSIRAHGFIAPVLVDRSGRIIAGHGRVEAAKAERIEFVPAVRVEHLDENQIRALMIADNRLSELSSWDDLLLAENFKLLSVGDGSVELVESTGFTVGETDLIIEGPPPSPSPNPDDEPYPYRRPPVNRLGDVWALGVHRIACGNSLEADTWSALMDGERAVMSCSDVPYNVPIAGNVSGLGKIRHTDFVMASGEMVPEAFTAFLETAFCHIAKHSSQGSMHYAFIDWRHLGEMQAAGEAAFTELKNVCVWDKGGSGGMGALYRSAHEFIFVWKVGRARHRNNVMLGANGRNRSNIWRHPGIAGFRHSDEGDLLALHATPKPVRMIADAILDVTARGELVVDAFLGSGTTIIAAERVGRRCYGIELDPRFADLAISRFERHSGESAVHLASGKTFAEMAVERQIASSGEATHA